MTTRPADHHHDQSDNIPIDEIWAEYRAHGDLTRANVLAAHYLPLLHRVIERITRRLPRHVDAEDLVQQGFFGLMHAIDGFDPGRGTKFTTFAQRRIRGAALDYLRTLDLFSRTARSEIKRLQAAQERIRQHLGREATDEELADELDVTTTAVARARGNSERVSMISMNRPAADHADNQSLRLADVLVDKNAPSPMSAIQRNDLRDYITRHLSRSERLIIILYYYEKMRMKEIGKVLGLSESRVSQMRTSIINRLRADFDNPQRERELMAV